MSTETENETVSTTAKAAPPPTHADMLFRYVAALLQTAGVQAFTLAVAVPKDDGTSAVVGMAAAAQAATDEWKNEIVKLLGEQAAKSAASVIAPAESKPVEVV